MNRRFLTALFVSALVLFAGCNAFGIGGDQVESSSDPTLTPAAVPTDRPTPTPVPEPSSGLTGNGIENLTVLLSEHNTTLQNTTFTRRTNHAARYPNGSLYSQRNTIFRAGTGSNRSFTYNIAGIDKLGRPPERVVIPTYVKGWLNGTQGVSVTTYTNNTTIYDDIPPEQRNMGGVLELGTGTNALSRLVGASETNITGNLTRNGSRFYRVNVATYRTPRRTLPGIPSYRDDWTFRNASQQLLIDSQGIVRRHRLTYMATNGTDSYDVTYTTRVTGLGRTTAERPPWYQKAVDENSTTSSTLASGENTD
jgi:hypothetical protein